MIIITNKKTSNIFFLLSNFPPRLPLSTSRGANKISWDIIVSCSKLDKKIEKEKITFQLRKLLSRKGCTGNFSPGKRCIPKMLGAPRFASANSRKMIMAEISSLLLVREFEFTAERKREFRVFIHNFNESTSNNEHLFPLNLRNKFREITLKSWELSSAFYCYSHNLVALRIIAKFL